MVLIAGQNAHRSWLIAARYCSSLLMLLMLLMAAHCSLLAISHQITIKLKSVPGVAPVRIEGQYVSVLSNMYLA